MDQQARSTLSGGAFTIDADLIVRSWDSWLERATGIPAAQACGQQLLALAPGMAARGILDRIRAVLAEGIVEVLAPAFHQYVIPCPPLTPTRYFDYMQQRVTITPLHHRGWITGAIITVEDVTARSEHERELSALLASADDNVRLRAVQALVADDKASPAEPLLEVIGDTSWRVRQVAVQGLSRQREAEVIAALVRVIRDNHHDLAALNSALLVLARSVGDPLPLLMRQFDSPDAEVRMYIALSLGQLHDLGAVAALMHALDDPDINVRYHVIEALGNMGATEAVERLVLIAETRDFFLAYPAITALGQIGDPRAMASLIPLLDDGMLNAAAAEALARIGDETIIKPLAALLSAPGTPVATIALALARLHDRYEQRYHEGDYIADLTQRAIDVTGAQALIASLPQSLPEELRALALVLGWLSGVEVEHTLTRLLGQSDARKEVVEALVRHGARVIDLLIEQLDADDQDTRCAAAAALGRIGDGRATSALVSVLDGETNLAIIAAAALAQIGDRRAFEPLLGMLGHAHAGVRQAVIAALNSIGHPDMGERMATLLLDPDPHVRESAVKIAGYFGYPECADALLERCYDADPAVCRAAVEHLPYLDDPRTLPTLIDVIQKGNAQARAAVVRALVYVDSAQAVPLLLNALTDTDPWVRYFAARSLGRHGAPESLDMLGALARDDAANQVRIAAIEALGSIGGARAVAMIAPFIDMADADLSRAALNALGQIGHPNALPLLLPALHSADNERRLYAIRALGERGGPDVSNALQAVAADHDLTVARAAITALARLASPEAIDALVALTVDADRREYCVAALASVGHTKAAHVARGLAHSDADVRCAAVDALARMKHPLTSERLSAALDDTAATVRLAAVMALSRLGSHHAERKFILLAQADTDATVRQAAQMALQRQPYSIPT